MRVFVALAVATRPDLATPARVTVLVASLIALAAGLLAVRGLLRRRRVEAWAGARADEGLGLAGPDPEIWAGAISRAADVLPAPRARRRHPDSSQPEPAAGESQWGDTDPDPSGTGGSEPDLPADPDAVPEVDGVDDEMPPDDQPLDDQPLDDQPLDDQAQRLDGVPADDYLPADHYVQIGDDIQMDDCVRLDEHGRRDELPAVDPEPVHALLDITVPDTARPDVSLPERTSPGVSLPVAVATEGHLPAAPQHGRHIPSPRQRKRLRAASRLLESLVERAEIARATAEEATELVEADSVALVVRSVEGPRVLWQHPGGADPADIWGPATLGALLGVGAPIREVVEGDPLIDYDPSALLVVPVPSAGMLAGAIVARRVRPRSFSPAEEDALARLARMAGAALDAASRRGYVAPGGGTDEATGFWPRDRLLNDLRAALRGLAQHGMPVSLLLAEVTGLAQHRRAGGTPAADQSLAAVSAAVIGALRVGDVPYRFGHDELAVLLPGTDADAASAVAERLQQELPELDPPMGLRAISVPVDGIAEDVVLAAVRALAAYALVG